MYLGIIGWYNKDCFAAAAARGLKALEFDINDNCNVPDFIEKIPETKELMKRYGVGVSAVGQWGTTRLLPDGSLNLEQLELEKQLMKGASELDCHVYITGCNRSEKDLDSDINGAIDYIGRLVEYGKEIGVKVCLYNCDWNNFLDHGEPMAKVLEALPELGLKYDTSHAICHGRDWKSEVRQWGHRFYHVHIKGCVDMGGWIDHPPAGLDETDWRALMGMLYAHKYDACLSLEPHSSIWQGPLGEKGINYTIEYIKPMIL